MSVKNKIDKALNEDFEEDYEEEEPSGDEGGKTPNWKALVDEIKKLAKALRLKENPEAVRGLDEEVDHLQSSGVTEEQYLEALRNYSLEDLGGEAGYLPGAISHMWSGQSNSPDPFNFPEDEYFLLAYSTAVDAILQRNGFSPFATWDEARGD